MKRTSLTLAAFALIAGAPAPRHALPPDFVYLSDVAPTVVQDIRYAGSYNFVGKPIAGYDAAECILTSEAARSVAAVERDLNQAGMTLRVYDCYRPKRAVDEFVAWSKNLADQRMKTAFYPRIDKAQLGHLGYITPSSEHSRGSAVDATIERLPLRQFPVWAPGEPLHNCTAPFRERYHDGSLDMGTSFNCFDELSRSDTEIGPVAESHRQTLDGVMRRHGFIPLQGEWWHFKLRWERYPSTYFDFPIERR